MTTSRRAVLHTDFKSAVLMMGRVVFALILRDIRTRYGRLKLGYLWALIEPLTFIVLVSIIFGIRGRHSLADVPLVLFLVTGFLPYYMFRDTLQRTLQAIHANNPLLAFPQVTPLDLMLARSLLEMGTNLVVFFIILLAVHLSGIAPVDVERPLEVLSCLLMLALLGSSFGVFFGSLAPKFPWLQESANIAIGRPTFWLSGIFYTADMVPEEYRRYLLYNPIFDLIEMLRSAFFRQYESVYYDIGYTVKFVLIAVTVALLTQRATRKYAYLT